MLLRCLVLTLIAISACAHVRADGTFFKHKSLQEAPAGIPHQRALIKFDGKHQSLFIESTLNGPKGNYSWVVPLPKKPLFVRAVKPAYVEGAFDHIKPRLSDKKTRSLAPPILAALLSSLLFLSAGYRYRKHDADKWINYLFEGAGALVVFFVMAWGSFEHGSIAAIKKSEAAASGSGGTGGPTVEDLGQIGSYRVHVLSASNGAAVMDWLGKRSFSVPDSASRAIHDYVAEGWVFLAAEIEKDEAKASPPHPLKAVIETDSPVYPMRLTGTQNEPLRLELAVVGPSQAKVEPLEAWACRDSSIFLSIDDEVEAPVVGFEEWVGGLYKVAERGEVTTYLRADLKPEAMRRDYAIGWTKTEVFSFLVLTAEQARGRTILWAVFAFPAVAYVFGIFGMIFGQDLRSGGFHLLLALLLSAGYTAFRMKDAKVVDAVEAKPAFSEKGI